jgi:acetylornithine deacetylase
MADWHIDTALVARYLQAMVRIDSVNPGLVSGAAGEAQIASWLLKTCRELGLEAWTQDTAPNRPNVIARWKGLGGGKSLLLTGHTDVVSVENMPGDPFDARMEGGRLYGRGALDMKSGLAAILGAVAALKADGFQPRGDVLLGFVTDEEYLSIGTEALVKEIRADAAILTEPTGMDIFIAHKGFVWLTVTTIGKAAHGSAYHDGIDAIALMGRVLYHMERMEREEFPKREHPLVGRPSVHTSFIKGGLGLSIYPDRCTLEIERRLLPEETPEQVLREWVFVLEVLMDADPRFSGNVKLGFSRRAYEIDRRAPIVETLDNAFQQVMGKAPNYAGARFWMDSALLGAAGIPTVVLGPSGVGLHAAEEYVELDSVYQCAAILAEAAARWTGNLHE